MKNVAKIFPLVLVLLPGLASAASVSTTWATSLVAGISKIVALLIPIVIAIALLMFIWGLVVYIANSGDEAAKEEGKRKMIWGVIALFVIIAIWGLVALLAEIFGVGLGATVTTPAVPGVQ